MRTRVSGSILVAAFALAASVTLFSQAAAQAGAPWPGHGGTGGPFCPSARARSDRRLDDAQPARNNRGYTNYTYTDIDEGAAVTHRLGPARFKEARDSNGGNYTLAQTNDPHVLTKCYPLGVPRVYFPSLSIRGRADAEANNVIYSATTGCDACTRTIHWAWDDPDLLWMGTSIGRWEDDQAFRIGSDSASAKEPGSSARQPAQRSAGRSPSVSTVWIVSHLQLDIKMEDPKGARQARGDGACLS